MFSLIGLGEGAGSGFPKILSAWNEESWRIPELKEETNLSQVSLKLWMISMLPEKCLEALNRIFGKAFNLFNKDEVLILATAYLEGSVNNARIQLMMDKRSYDITGILKGLMEKKTLLVDGYGRGKVYYINLEYDSKLKEVNEGGLSEDEIKVINYISENGSINNQQSRDNLAFGKDKNVALFNSLIKKGKIKRKA